MGEKEEEQQQPSPERGERRQRSAEEQTIEGVTAAYERQRAAEQALKDKDVLPSIEDP